MIKKLLLITILLSTLVLITNVNTSFAENPAEESPIVGELTLECDKMNDKVLEYAQSQGWCLNETEGFNSGDCGSVAFDIVDDPYSSYIAQFSMYLWSSKGPMANVNYNVSWLNYSTGIGNSFGGSEWPYSSSWGKLTADETGNGYVVGQITGVVTLIWGGTCAIIPTSDGANIQ